MASSPADAPRSLAVPVADPLAGLAAAVVRRLWKREGRSRVAGSHLCVTASAVAGRCGDARGRGQRCGARWPSRRARRSQERPDDTKDARERASKTARPGQPPGVLEAPDGCARERSRSALSGAREARTDRPVWRGERLPGRGVRGRSATERPPGALARPSTATAEAPRDAPSPGRSEMTRTHRALWMERDVHDDASFHAAAALVTVRQPGSPRTGDCGSRGTFGGASFSDIRELQSRTGVS